MSEVNSVKAFDSGTVDVDVTEVTVTLELQVSQLLIYPTVNASVTLNDGTTKSIFLPKEMWTPISISRDFLCTNFVITAEEAGKVHWQGWVI